MAAQLPRCALCRVTIKVHQNVVFRTDGRVQHTQCPAVTCGACGRPITPDMPIRRDDGELLHSHCWMRRLRASARGR